MMKRSFIFLVFVLFIVSCAPDGQVADDQVRIISGSGSYDESSFNPDDKVEINSFKDDADYQDFIRSQSSSGGYSRDFVAQLESFSNEASLDDSMAVGKSAPSILDFSETNNQVEDVDEADIIKTDGDFIYTVSDNMLYIVKAFPGDEAKVVFSVELSNRPSGIFIYDDKLAVFGNFYDSDFFSKMDFRPRYGMTFFEVYDISDRENPELIKEYKFEGSYFRARMIDEYVYFITKTSPEFRNVYPTPVIMDGGEIRSIPASDVFYFNIPYNNPQLVSINSINLEDVEEDISSVSVAVEYGQNLYMSSNNIYISYGEYINEYDIEKDIMMELMKPYLSESDKELIEKIKKTDNDVLSQSEKEQKIYSVYESLSRFIPSDEQEELSENAEKLLKEKLAEYEYFEYTIINRISVDGNDISVEANGKVPGRIINQFSMDEFDSNLRIGTTINARWSRYDGERTESTNHVYALNENLEIIGSLKGLADGERIYSTRFIDDRLYLVTFKQVDPFFVIDLSNPKNIKNMGELKIPGFSRYLHPYDDNTIIGIGRDATDGGRTEGLKISLFDVSDIENPKEIAKYVTDAKYSSSTAEYEHKAFLFSKEKNLLVIPAYSRSYREENGNSENYNGAFVFNISKDEIELRGLIDHSMAENENYWSPSVERSLYIENLLYTKSPYLIRINDLDDLHSVKNVSLKKAEGEIKKY